MDLKCRLYNSPAAPNPRFHMLNLYTKQLLRDFHEFLSFLHFHCGISLLSWISNSLSCWLLVMKRLFCWLSLKFSSGIFESRVMVVFSRILSPTWIIFWHLFSLPFFLCKSKHPFLLYSLTYLISNSRALF